jgi:hypothetical protein
MKVKEAIAILERDMHTLETLMKESKGAQFIIRQRAIREKEIILQVYKTIDPNADILVAEENLLITLS